MNTTYGQRLEEALRLTGKDRQQLADALHISVQAVSQVVLGRTKALTAENSARAARFIGVDGYWLATGVGEPMTETTETPGWPFRAPRDDYDRLSDKQKSCLDTIVAEFIKASLDTFDNWGRPAPSGAITAKAPSAKRAKHG